MRCCGCGKAKAGKPIEAPLIEEPPQVPQPPPPLPGPTAPPKHGDKKPSAVPPRQFRVGLGEVFPDFECKTTSGDFMFHKFLDQPEPGWTMLFSHPKDFTPVCTTEIGACHVLLQEFQQRGVKLIGLSCDSVLHHKEWAKDVLAAAKVDPGQELGFPLIADEMRAIAERLGMLDPLEVSDADHLPMPARALFLIGPDKTNRLTILYPATTGRNFAEVLRVIDSLHLTDAHEVGTPANWHPGDPVTLNPSFPSATAHQMYDKNEERTLPSGKKYMRYVSCPELKHKAAAGGPLQEEMLEGSTSEFRMKLGARFPDFDCVTTQGILRFHKLLERNGGGWTVLFSWPSDFQPVSTTEVAAWSDISNDLRKRGVKLVGLSCDSLQNHQQWSEDVTAVSGKPGTDIGFPLIADETRQVAELLGMVGKRAEMRGTVGRTASLTTHLSGVRGLFVIGPDKTNRLSMLYPETTGYNMNEVLRALDSLRLTQNPIMATPANWQPGDRVIVDPKVSPEQATQKFTGLEIVQLPSRKQYLRYAQCPSSEPAPLRPAAFHLPEETSDLPTMPPHLEMSFPQPSPGGKGLWCTC
mmetsp:Transcript_33901/g.60972  ORF Transcript_33901/g.60972 Transcript_33901/m.60972 type:complete len:581 (+) Transcript_33901:98-1840(+)